MVDINMQECQFHPRMARGLDQPMAHDDERVRLHCTVEPLRTGNPEGTNEHGGNFGANACPQSLCNTDPAGSVVQGTVPTSSKYSKNAATDVACSNDLLEDHC